MASARSLLYREVLPFAAMVTVECTVVGTNTLYKAATLKGLSYYVFVLYTAALANILLFPFAFISYRRSILPPISSSILLKFCYLGLLGMLFGILQYKGIEFSNPTLASAISNLVPAFTFILAILFRMEKVDFKSYTSLARVAGTIIAIIGAFVVVLCKGSAIILGSTSLESSLPLSDWIIGGLLLSAAYVLLSLWYIVLAQTMKAYPAELVVVFLFNVSATIFVAPVCIAAERDLSGWKVTDKTALIAIVYAGIIGSCFGIIVHTWGLHLKGPVYVALFKPLSIVIAAAMGISFLGETLYTGSIIGGIIISIGFYVAIWGKENEENSKDIDVTTEPLLQRRLPRL